MTIFKELRSYAKTLTLLVVEDDRFLNEELSSLATLLFKNVRTAYDGAEALAIYKEETIDIVLSDITMPDMDGIELCKKIKVLNPDQDIIILSAHNEVEYFVELIDIGVRQFVHKPFKDEEFLYRLLKVCENVALAKFYAQEQQEETKELEKDVPCKIVEKPTQSAASVLAKKQLSSKKFLNQIQQDATWNLVSDDITTLIEISDDFEVYINQIYEGELTHKLLVNMSFLLKKMQNILSQIQIMREMAALFLELAEFMQEVDFDALGDEQKQKFKMLEFIYDDIARFVQTVFVYKDTIDIHYLKDSLKSSIEQLKIAVLNAPFEEEEFELF